jgi:triacylglycerol lipase
MRCNWRVWAAIASCLMILTACAGTSSKEVSILGATIIPAKIDFANIYTYAGRSAAAYGPEANIRAKYPATKRIAVPANSGTRYFLEQDDKAKTQIITVRGTADNKNFQQDFDIKVRDDRKTDIPVHAGFDRDARAIYADMKPFLKSGYTTYVTGHSLGGAVAAILTIYLIEDGYKVDKVVTFGQPRFTTADGVKRLGFLPITRIVDENDIIPMVPPATVTDPKFGPYQQVGPEIILLEGPRYVYLPSHDATRISFGEFWRDISIADLPDHKMTKYLARILSKESGAIEVSYDSREKFVAQDPRKTASN